MPDRPVVFVPGFPASHLKRASDGDFVFLDVGGLLFRRTELLPDLMGPDDLADRSIVPAHPIAAALKILFFDLLEKAASLYDVLRAIGYETEQPNAFFRAVGWDWRKPVDDGLVQSNLREAIVTLHHDSGRRPVAIVHSTGGLVLRALLEAEPELADRLESVVAFGVPWGGTLRTLPLLAGVESFGPVPKEETQMVMAHAWAAYDLLPPATANAELRLALDAAGNPVDVFADRSWFPAPLRVPMDLRADHAQAQHAGRTPEIGLGGRPLAILNVVGFGAKTFRRATVAAAGAFAIDDSQDDETLDDGDGTTPRRSGSWLAGPQVRTFELPLGFYPGHHLTSLHDTLWKNPGGQDILWNELAGEPWQPFVHLALDGGDVNTFGPTLRLRMAALDEQGAPLQQVRVTFQGLVGGAKAKKEVSLDGRALFTVPRTGIVKTGDGRFRRLSVKVTWKGGSPVERNFLIPV